MVTGIFSWLLCNPEICTKAVHVDPYSLEFVPIDLITQEMCNEVVEKTFMVFDIYPWLVSKAT